MLMAADKVLLPGVGDASVALASLRSLGLDSVIPSLKCPVLGICVGMQVMCRHSEEGDAAGLGIFGTDGSVPFGRSFGQDSAHGVEQPDSFEITSFQGIERGFIYVFRPFLLCRNL